MASRHGYEENPINLRSLLQERFSQHVIPPSGGRGLGDLTAGARRHFLGFSETCCNVNDYVCFPPSEDAELRGSEHLQKKKNKKRFACF